MSLIDQYTKSYWDIVRLKFMRKVKQHTSGCWEWQGARNDAGYGLVHIPTVRKSEYAHRLSFELFKEPIINGNVVMHICDNPCCVNPDHLRQGSHSDNMLDKMQKGRHNTGLRPSLYGTLNPSVKLTPELVSQIRQSYSIDKTSIRILARQYNISSSQVHRIIKHQSWSQE